MNTFEHGGNIHKVVRDSGVQFLDFSANINPLGAPEWLRAMVSCDLQKLAHYPDPEYFQLRQAIAAFHKTGMEQVVVGNGTSELLQFFMLAMARSGRIHLLLPVPSYVDYRRAAELAGIAVSFFSLKEENDFLPDFALLEKSLQRDDLLVLARPNNPTGAMPAAEDIRLLAERRPDVIVLLDEAFVDFCDGEKGLGGTLPNICSINSMTKFYGVPGLRIGYGIFPGEIAEELCRLLPPWSVNSLAESFAREALADSVYQQESRKNCDKLRHQLIVELRRFAALAVFPSAANFLLLKVDEGKEHLADFCQQQGILIRRCSNYDGLMESKRFFRIAVRTEEENSRLLSAFSLFFAEKKGGKEASVRKAKMLMLQGTCSDAGKSILAAGLCRIFLQDGVAVAPFKAQNMSLNSFVTLQGDEMGRAQVVQAQAARLDPQCRMNPVLLKPNSDTGSQVIVCGKPVGNMGVLEYNAYKPQIWPQVCNCFDSLAAEFEVVVLEGAGSPGEINLKHDDIVNMRMAQYANAAVLLVGDIDRGGVYASFIGIMETLTEWERRLLAGFIVNKFRGQASLLQPAHDYLLRYTGKPVLGVVPWLANLGLPEEDSVSFKQGSFNRGAGELHGEGKEVVDIAVISLPHISNFTDIEPFLAEPDVLLRVVDTVKELGTPDAVILAGSKNVLHDLQFLYASGFADALKKIHRQGGEIVGICGGYQMLGRAICDPYKLESSLGEMAGLGFLDMVTVIERKKNLVRKSGVHAPSNKHVSGYEIHHGISSGEQNLLIFDDGSRCGLAAEGVWGSYLHGIFDRDEFRRYCIDSLRQKKGLVPLNRVVAPYDLEAAFDRLADSLRKNLDMDFIYQLLGL